jgi:hypothetical protein
MAKLFVAALLAVAAASVQAQPVPSAGGLQPSADPAERRQALRKLSVCLAKARPRWARQTLSHPYLSPAQATAAAEALIGRDNCIGKDDADIMFRTSAMVGSLAEHFVRPSIENTDVQGLGRTLNSLPPLNASEDFALCVAVRDVGAARDLVLSEPGSTVETQAAERLANHVRPCTNEGEQLTVELQSLRAMVSVALYRALKTAL